MSSGANGLVLAQLTRTPGMSASEAGSGHGSARRDQFIVAAIAHSVKPSTRIADNPQGDCFRLDRRAPAGMPARRWRSISPEVSRGGPSGGLNDSQGVVMASEAKQSPGQSCTEPKHLQGLLEDGLVILALRRGEPAVEIGIERPERKL